MVDRVAISRRVIAALARRKLLPTEVDTACVAFRADLQRTRAATRLKDALIARGRALHRALELPSVRRQEK